MFISRSITLMLLAVFVAGEVSFAGMPGQVLTKRERALEEARETGSSSSDLYEKIQESYLKGDYASSLKKSQEFLRKTGERINRDEVLYLEALSFVKLGRYPEAHRDLGSLQKTASTERWRKSAFVADADLYVLEGKPFIAYPIYQNLLSSKEDFDEKDYVREAANKLNAAQVSANRSATPFISKPVKESGVVIYTVQLGSFSDRKNAQSLLERALSLHYDAHLVPDQTRGLYRVRVGQSTTRSVMEDLTKRLQKDGLRADVLVDR